MKKILHLICATRPNVMKIAPLYHAIKNDLQFSSQIIHTGQHYDPAMAQTLFDDFDLPAPHYHLGVGSGSHAEQTANTMMAYEALCLRESQPDLVVVVGDVNATLACSIAAKKLLLPVAHLEAGLRSFDRSMPEEINRIVTDSVSDYLWTPSPDADVNLIKEGIGSSQIDFVGNIMMDAYCLVKQKIDNDKILTDLHLEPKRYATITLHRPVNVDNLGALSAIMHTLSSIPMNFVFPVHPRTKKNMEKLDNIPHNIQLIDPLGYIRFMKLVSESTYVISDSGGIQEETTYLNIPCFTLRENTERPITITQGSNQLVSVNTLAEKIAFPKKGTIPDKWDGKTAERIHNLIRKIFSL